MKKLIVLMFCLFVNIGNVSASDCFSCKIEEDCAVENLMCIDAIIGSIPKNLIYFNNLEFGDLRHINDLGHEFPVESYIMGTYWRGGAWSISRPYYYGNTYWTYFPYWGRIPGSCNPIPEPATIFLLIAGSLVFINRKKNIWK